MLSASCKSIETGSYRFQVPFFHAWSNWYSSSLANDPLGRANAPGLASSQALCGSSAKLIVVRLGSCVRCSYSPLSACKAASNVAAGSSVIPPLASDHCKETVILRQYAHGDVHNAFGRPSNGNSPWSLVEVLLEAGLDVRIAERKCSPLTCEKHLAQPPVTLTANGRSHTLHPARYSASCSPH